VQREAFWALFDEWCREAGSPELVPQTVLTRLSRFGDTDIVAFDRHLRARLASSNTWRMRGAAHLISGGCTAQSFQSFRLWLMTRGREVYEGINADPDRLSELDPRWGQLEPLLFVPTRAYEAATNGRIPFTPVPDPTLDKAWSFDDEQEMKSRYPRLWEICS
jgi:hypothetical protein